MAHNYHVYNASDKTIQSAIQHLVNLNYVLIQTEWGIISGV